MIVTFHLSFLRYHTKITPYFFYLSFLFFFFSPAVTLLSHHCDTSDTKKQVHVFPLQSPEQLPVPQTAETRMAKMKKKISSPLLKRKNISSGELFDFSWVISLQDGIAQILYNRINRRKKVDMVWKCLSCTVIVDTIVHYFIV